MVFELEVMNIPYTYYTEPNKPVKKSKFFIRYYNSERKRDNVITLKETKKNYNTFVRRNMF